MQHGAEGQHGWDVSFKLEKSGTLSQLLDVNGCGNPRKYWKIEGIDLFSILCFSFLLWVKLCPPPKKEILKAQLPGHLNETSLRIRVSAAELK